MKLKITYILSTSPKQVKCPPGTFGGPEGGLGSASCSGLCHPGYYCPGDGKSINATRFACADVSPGTHLDWDQDGDIDDGLPEVRLSGDGELSSVFCPRGSGRPIPVSEGFYTLGGGSHDSKIVSYRSYDIDAWPSGESVGNLGDHIYQAEAHRGSDHHLGERELQSRDLSSSSSYIDSEGHTGTDRVPGRTTVPSSQFSPGHLLEPHTYLNGYTRSSQRLCEPGTYCRNGVRRLCPPGTFGIKSGLTINTCTGSCSPGFYCTAGSTSAEEHPCPAGRFGATNGLPSALCSGLCARGHYCPRNSTTKYQFKCPAGRYGSVEGLGDENCGDGVRKTPRSCLGGVGGVTMAGNDAITMAAVGAPPSAGPHNNLNRGKADGHEVAGYGDVVCGAGGPALCEPGYWCPPGSVSPTQIRCGNTSVYCPEGSSSPTLAPPGKYTIEGRIVEGEHRVTHFGGQQRGNAPATATTTVYPNNNANTAADTSAFASSPPEPYPHFYSVGGIVGPDLSNILSRQPFQNQNDGSQNIRGRYHPMRSPSDLGGTSLLEVQTRSGVLDCPSGSYCMGGVRRACPRGRFGASERLSDPGCDGPAALGHWTRAGAITATQMKCAPGRYADREGSTSAGCTGPCDHGFWCGAGSASRRENECGGREYFCPIGSRQPRRASRGWYTIPEDPDSRILGSNPEGTARERRAQKVCPEGHWCQRGVKSICAAGKYGAVKGLYSSRCSGFCKKVSLERCQLSKKFDELFLSPQ